MSNTNLTRVEAESRAAHVSVQAYDVRLDLTSDGPTFDSTTTVRFTSTDPTASCWLDLIAPEVSSVASTAPRSTQPSASTAPASRWQ